MLLSFSLCLSAVGQGYNYANLPFLGAGVSNFPTAGLYLRWKDSDLSNGAVPAWVDEIQHAYMTNGSGGTQPLMTSTGLVFSSGNFLWSTNTSGGGFPVNTSTYIVFNPEFVVAGGGHNISLLNNTANGDSLSYGAGQLNACCGNVVIANALPTNTLCDIEMGLDISASSVTYTNGVLSDPTGKYDAGWTFFMLPTSATALVREVAVWTNTTLTAAFAQQIYQYRTNVYGGH